MQLLSLPYLCFHKDFICIVRRAIITWDIMLVNVRASYSIKVGEPSLLSDK